MRCWETRSGRNTYSFCTHFLFFKVKLKTESRPWDVEIGRWPWLKILYLFGAPVSRFVRWGVKIMAQICVTWESHAGMATGGFPRAGVMFVHGECYLALLQLLHSGDGEWLFCLSHGNMVQVLAFFLALGGTSCRENMVLHSSCLWKVLCWEIARGNWQGAQILIFVVQGTWERIVHHWTALALLASGCCVVNNPFWPWKHRDLDRD